MKLLVHVSVSTLMLLAFAGSMSAQNSPNLDAQAGGASSTNAPQASPMPCVPLSEEDKASLNPVIRQQEQHFERARVMWSRLYHGSLYGSIILSALAALTLKLNIFARQPYRRYRSDAATIFTTLAALLTTVNGIGEFNGRWIANREAGKSIEVLKIQMLDRCADGSEMRKRLSEIIIRQSAAGVASAQK